jgi:two-component system, response regulator PdtaR
MAVRNTMDASTSQLTMLHRISSIVNSNLSLDEKLGEVIGLAVQASACDACLVYLIDPVTHEMVLRASQAPHVDDIGQLHVKSGEGITGWVAEHKSVVALSENAFKDPRFKKFPQLFEDTYEALLSVPLVGGGKTIGVINVHHREPYRHSSEEISMMVFIGEQLGGAISNSLLEEERARLLEETQEMKRALETRKVMERAKGILQQRHQISEEEAYLRLRNQSRRLRRPMKELAEAIILAEDLGRASAPDYITE